MKEMRVVLDTNIVVSGLLFGGIPLKILKSGFQERFIWLVSPPLIDELERVLLAKKFGLSKSEIQTLVKPIFEVIEVVVPTSEVNIIQRCPGDNRVLECAVDGKCDFIVTGDRRDLLSLKRFGGIEIITARRFHDALVTE